MDGDIYGNKNDSLRNDEMVKWKDGYGGEVKMEKEDIKYVRKKMVDGEENKSYVKGIYKWMRVKMLEKNVDEEWKF